MLFTLADSRLLDIRVNIFRSFNAKQEAWTRDQWIVGHFETSQEGRKGGSNLNFSVLLL